MFYAVLNSRRQWLIQSRPEKVEEPQLSPGKQFEAKIEEQLEIEARFYYKNQPKAMQRYSPYSSTIKHIRNDSDSLPPSGQQSNRENLSAETKKQFLKRKKVYDPKEAIKKQKLKQNTNKENNAEADTPDLARSNSTDVI